MILGDLDLCTCTETIMNVSISNGAQLSKEQPAKKKLTFVQEYMARPEAMELLSLHQYFHLTKNEAGKRLIFPNFVGINGTPCYPVSIEYARQTLIVHRPWRTYPRNLDWIAEFNQFINTPDAPKAAKLTYQRVMQRYIDKTTGYDPVAKKVEQSKNDLKEEEKELLYLTGLKASEECDEEDHFVKSFERGLDFNWSKPAKVRRGIGHRNCLYSGTLAFQKSSVKIISHSEHLWTKS